VVLAEALLHQVPNYCRGITRALCLEQQCYLLSSDSRGTTPQYPSPLATAPELVLCFDSRRCLHSSLYIFK